MAGDDWDFEGAVQIDVDAYSCPPSPDPGASVAAGLSGYHRPPLKLLTPPRFDANDREGFLPYLEKHGYCVIARAADAAAVDKGNALFWDFLEQGDPDGRHIGDVETDLKRDDVSTWGNDRWVGKVSMPEAGIINAGGIGHSRFAWHVRLQPAVRKVFSAIWETDSLLTSYDGACAFRPWGRHSEWITEGGWYHVDQGRTRPNRCCVQGVMLFTDATKHTGGLVVIPGSHKEFGAVIERNATYSNGDYVPLSTWDPILAGGSAGMVCAHAGDLLLWDSRTVHCNAPGIPNEAGGDDDTKLLRIAGYVCMTPAAWASPRVLELRRQAFETKKTTTHWPHTYCATGDGLADAGERAGSLLKAPAEVRALVDGGDALNGEAG